MPHDKTISPCQHLMEILTKLFNLREFSNLIFLKLKSLAFYNGKVEKIGAFLYNLP